jgi:hypothetical protein
MHGRLATGTVGVFGLDRHIHARQMGGKRAAIGAALFATRPCGRRVLLVVGGLVCGNGLLDILECQKHLLGIELLRTPAELCTLQLAQEMPQAIDLRKRTVALCNRGVMGASCFAVTWRSNTGVPSLAHRARARWSAVLRGGCGSGEPRLSVQHAIGTSHELDAELIHRPLSAAANVQSNIFLDARLHVDLGAGAVETTSGIVTADIRASARFKT